MNPAEKFLTSFSAMAEEENGENENGTDKNKIVYIPWHLIREVNVKDSISQRFSFNEDKIPEIAESIRTVGITTPLIVRRDPLELVDYQILSGRHRWYAVKYLRDEYGIELNLPCIIRDVDDIEAEAIMAASNRQREEITTMEKAWMYRAEYELMKKQGQRTDLTCGQIDHKLETGRTLDKLADKSEDSRKTIQRLIRLTYLIPHLADYIEKNQKKRLPLGAAADISYLNPTEQDHVLAMLHIHHYNVTLDIAKKLKEASKEKADENTMLTTDDVKRIFEEGGAGLNTNANKKISFSFNRNIIDYFPTSIDSRAKREMLLEKLLELHKDELEELAEDLN